MKKSVRPIASKDHVYYHEFSNINTSFNCPRTIESKFICSLQSNKEKLSQVQTINYDSTSFIVDTGTSDHICNDKELFVEKIKPCHGIKINGVGGHLETHGHGKISIRVADEERRHNQLQIDNVLYVPALQVNLLSPQRLSSSNGDPRSTSNL